jgi:hypothetical protein
MTGRAQLAEVHRQLACQRWDRAEGGERREKVRDLSAKSKNNWGVGEKGAKTHSSQGQIVTPDLQGHKPSSHICARIKSHIYTTESSRYHNTYHEIKAYKL